MKFTIYDYANQPTVVETDYDIEDVDFLVLQVCSGDEIVTIELKDGSRFCYDSSDSRVLGFNDGLCVLKNTKIRDFVEWTPHGHTFSYTRICDMEDT